MEASFSDLKVYTLDNIKYQTSDQDVLRFIIPSKKEAVYCKFSEAAARRYSSN